MKSKIDAFFNRESNKEAENNKIFFTNFISTFIDDSKTSRNRLGNDIKRRTIQHYITTQNKILAFEKEHNVKLKISDIDLEFHNFFREKATVKQQY
ncbi:hypothetical protein INQ45_00395 [Flavobacterium columnare]|uniref:hypothetical protein n=1 Tax=Flavobacterium columnare TaxID=996 RepID=UPI002D20850B|nr:hypothetical protein [Flavobacterium columnare]MEB3799601.1 hypothetical protein [Flavobacterium columnare]